MHLVWTAGTESCSVLAPEIGLGRFMMKLFCLVQPWIPAKSCEVFLKSTILFLMSAPE